MTEIQAAMARVAVKKGDHVRHVEYGPVTVLKVRSDGAIIVRCQDGIEGTTSLQSLRRL